jgi:glycerol-3-phosphate O-acyltransferase/dihydroxyacetone phosphate acyltransferase
MMILTGTNREVSFTMAASSFTKPIIGQCAKALNCIPVHRPEDHKKKGNGKVKFISPTEVKGIATNFVEDAKGFNKGVASILIGNQTFIVEKIIDSETIAIKQHLDDLSEFHDKEFDYFWIPKIDNSELFKEAYQRLADNGCICIFPEGTSHDRSDFIKLKAGIALMTLGAMSEKKCQNVNIVPVGLNYFKREQFRSEVVIEFGKAFEVPTEWANEYLVNKRDATEKLLKEIESVNIIYNL